MLYVGTHITPYYYLIIICDVVEVTAGVVKLINGIQGVVCYNLK